MTEHQLLAVDPGGEHVGLAMFNSHLGEWRCARAWEETPAESIKTIRGLLDRNEIETLIYEGFRLFPWMRDVQTWNSFPTVELIGVIKYLWAVHGEKDVRLVEQLSDKQKPTQAILRARGMVSEAKRTRAGPHALSAELHGWHHILNTLVKEREGTA